MYAIKAENSMLRNELLRLEGSEPRFRPSPTGQVPSVYGVTPYPEGGHFNSSKASLYEILYQDTKRLKDQLIAERDAQVGDFQRQLKQAHEGFSSHKVQANHEAAQQRKETSEQGEEINRLMNEKRLVELQYSRETTQLRNASRLDKMKQVLRRWQRIQLNQAVMGWLKNLWAGTGMGSAQRRETRDESESMRRDAVRVQSQLDNTKQEVSRMMHTISNELKELERQKKILRDEVRMVQVERAQIREVVALSKKAEGGPQAAELALLRSELLALKEAKDSRDDSDAGVASRRTMPTIKEGRDAGRARSGSRERSGSRDKTY